MGNGLEEIGALLVGEVAVAALYPSFQVQGIGPMVKHVRIVIKFHYEPLTFAKPVFRKDGASTEIRHDPQSGPIGGKNGPDWIGGVVALGKGFQKKVVDFQHAAGFDEDGFGNIFEDFSPAVEGGEIDVEREVIASA